MFFEDNCKRFFASSVGVRKFRGTDLLFSTITHTIGLDDDLAKVFGDRAPQIASIAYYLVANPEAPLYRFSSWHRLHYHPYGKDIPSPRSSELFGSITEDEIQQFLREYSGPIYSTSPVLGNHLSV